MSRNFDTTFEGLFNEIKGKKNKSEKSEIEKKDNTKLSQTNNINSDDDWFSDSGVITPGNQTVKIKPQNETEYAHINARDFYFRQLRNLSDIKNNDFSQEIKVQGIDPSLTLRVSLAELNCIITNSQGVSKVMPLSKLYEKVFKGADPAQDLLAFNLEQDKLYKDYCEREGNKSFNAEAKKEYVEDVFGEFTNTPVESSFVKAAKEVLGDEVDVIKDDGATVVSTKSRRGRPKKEEITATTESVLVIDEKNNIENVVYDDRLPPLVIGSKTKNLDIEQIAGLEVEKTASLLSSYPGESKTETEAISDRDFEGFTRIITAIARAILNK